MSIPRTARTIMLEQRPAPPRPWPPERKLRLFACACCRRSWERLSPACRAAVAAGERRADGVAAVGELEAAWRAARGWEKAGWGGGHLETVDVHRVAAPVFTPADAAAVAADLRPWRGDRIDNDEADEAHRHLYADVLGGPPPAPFDPWWRTPAVLGLADVAYRERRFEILPDLADRLKAAGCDDLVLLAHLRSALPHARGCWALDRVLGLG